MMGVTHAKTPTTPGIRPKQPTEAEEKAVDETRQRVLRAIVGKAQWILRARPDVLYAVKELSRRLQGPREVDLLAAKRMVKYLYGKHDTALQLRPRKGTLRLDSPSDSDWAGCPTTTKSSSGAMVWLNGALMSSLCKTQGFIALSSPEAEYYACTVGVAEAKFIQSILLDWGVTAEIEHFVDNSCAITLGRRIGLGGMRHMETRYLWIQEELRAQRMKLTKVKETENATDVATKHVDATTQMKCMVTIGLIKRTRHLLVVHHKTYIRSRNHYQKERARSNKQHEARNQKRRERRTNSPESLRRRRLRHPRSKMSSSTTRGARRRSHSRKFSREVLQRTSRDNQ